MTYVTRPNTWLSQDVSSLTHLTYALQLNPSPLTVSVAGKDPVIGSLQFVVTNPTASAIAVDSIAFTAQIGPAGSDLTPTTAGVGHSVSDAAWLVTSPAEITSGPAVWSLGPATGLSIKLDAGATVVVEIYGFATVENTGNTTITVKETTSFGIAVTSFLVTTFPTGFFFNGLTATTLHGSQRLPAAEVALGETVDLTWNSSVVDTESVRIYYSNAVDGPAKPTAIGRWTSPKLTSDTVFTVAVTVSVAGGAPLSAAMTTAVSVLKPALVASSLHVVGAITTTSLHASGPIATTGTVSGVGICPPGTIVMWSGDINNRAAFDGNGTGVTGSAYQGWQLCNGNNGSPDLRDRFIVGAGRTYNVGAIGGSNDVTLATAQMPAHSHFDWTGETAPFLNYDSVAFNSKGVSSGLMVNRGTDDPNGYRPNLTTTTGWRMVQVLPHNHRIPWDGGGQPHENRPPYYAMAYLMRLAG